MSVVGEVMKVVTGVSDYKHGKAIKNAERKGLNTSSQAHLQLQDLMSDPSSVTEMPMYKAGLEAVQRTLGQQGLTGSGNAVLGLAEYGSNFYQQQLSSLAAIAQGGTPAYGTGSNLMAAGAGRASEGLQAGAKMVAQAMSGGAAGGGGSVASLG